MKPSEVPVAGSNEQDSKRVAPETRDRVTDRVTQNGKKEETEISNHLIVTIND